MWLLNTHTAELKFFHGPDKVPGGYAILSHVWSDSEVSYKDWTAGRKQNGYGYQKITKICEFARETYKLEWAWVDTCCINKADSAELSEAINSMYAWYAGAAMCYAHLHAVPAGEDAHAHLLRLVAAYRGW